MRQSSRRVESDHRSFVGPEQTRAVALWGAASAIGAALGPLVGGVLVDLRAGRDCSGSTQPLPSSGSDHAERSRRVERPDEIAFDRLPGDRLVAAILVPSSTA